MLRRLLIPLVLLTALIAVVRFLSMDPDPAPLEPLSLADALQTDLEGYDRAYGPRPIVFPADHGPHPDFKLEWWYVTGNLDDDEGNPFGYQVTIFRNALAPPGDGREPDLPWATRQLYIAHVAVTDGGEGTYVSEERVVRAAGGAAGARKNAMDVWVGPVSIRGYGDGLDSLHVDAPVGESTLSLTLKAQKPIVFQGDQGFSAKSDAPGNASYYYSVTRFSAAGTLVRDGRSIELSGTSWLDREWSTSLLDRTQTGWDWFSLQLDDGSELMYFRLREEDPSVVPYRDGVLIRPDGQRIELDVDDMTLTSSGTWTSPASGATYPTNWRLQVPAHAIDVAIDPLIPDQEFRAALHYWEGAVRVSGSHTGRGYAELTGYERTP